MIWETSADYKPVIKYEDELATDDQGRMWTALARNDKKNTMIVQPRVCIEIPLSVWNEWRSKR